MNGKRKISIRKILQSLLTMLLLAAVVFVVLSASKRTNEQNIKGTEIVIKNEDYCQFVSKDEVRKRLFEQRHVNPQSLKVSTINLKQLENILCTNPWIEYAQVFVDNQHKLNIQVSQRVPQLRVFDRIGNTYYVDSTGKILPITDNYTHYELLFVNVPQLKEDSIGALMLKRMIKLAQYIKRDSFWLAQTSEVIVHDHQNFELVPVLGSHKILLGDLSNLSEKLENVYAFYQNVLNKIGWDKYTLIDARYKNQVVASPSLPWKAPVDRALSNMNWVKTIVGDLKVDEAAAQNATMNMKANTADTNKLR